MKKIKGAQEAHECIRVTNLTTTLNDKYTEDDHKLYNLIKKRSIFYITISKGIRSCKSK